MRDWTFDRKLHLFLLAVILPTTLAVLITSTWASISSIGEKSRALMQIQLDGASDDLAVRLERYKDLSVAAMLDASVKRYLETPARTTPALGDTRIDDARNAITSLCQVDGRIISMAVVKAWPGEYVFKGSPISWFTANYERTMSQSIRIGYGEARMSRSTLYTGDPTIYTFIYTPIYRTQLPTERTGDFFLCVRDNLVSTVLMEQNSGLRLETSLISAGDGMTLASSAVSAALNVPYRYDERLVGRSGSFSADGSLFAYQKVGRWAFYLVGEMPQMALYGDSIQTAVVLGMLILLFVALSLVFASAMVKRIYGSLGQLKLGMETVKQGDLSVRLGIEGVGEDFRMINEGFNDMAGRIDELMEQVKAEQRQIERIRYDALQAQIHPHFLYNTLDCIRWMARADGNPELVRLVRAMSQFYRICLSKGKDVIPLGEELKFTDSYMLIQNIRYAGVIHYSADVPEPILGIQIPKITIQPLVENCVMHGLKSEAKSFRVRVLGRMERDRAVITVEDDGSGMSEEGIEALNTSLKDGGEQIGFGVRNVHRRIVLLFGEGYGLTYLRSKSGGIAVEIRLPGMEVERDV